LAPNQFLFPPAAVHQPLMLAAIREAAPYDSLRSMRRGALQTLATTPLQDQTLPSIETLLHFSGHTNARTLKRYLNWGKLFGAEAAAGLEAARALQAAGQH
jgi:hypothetical protein